MTVSLVFVDAGPNLSEERKNLSKFRVRSYSAQLGHQRSRQKKSPSRLLKERNEDTLEDDWTWRSSQPTSTYELAPIYSGYLQNNYSGCHLDDINNAVEYFMRVAGPTYVWNFESSEREHEEHQTAMVRRFLWAPAFTEAILAWIFCLMLGQQQGSGTSDRTMKALLNHQSRALGKLRELLSDPGENKDVILWSLICIMVLSHERGDWASFNIHLRGLEQFIAAIGGTEALRKYNTRAFFFTEWLRPLKPPTSSKVLAEPPDSFSAFATPSGDDLSSQSEPSDMSTASAAIKFFPAFGRATTTLQKCYELTHSNVSDQETRALLAEKSQVEAALSDLVRLRAHQIATDNNVVVCIGFLIRLASCPPYPDTATHYAGLAPTSVTKLVQMLEDSAYIIAANCRWDFVLWTSMVMVVMGANISPTLKKRQAIVRKLVQKWVFKLEWTQIREAFEKIYLNPDMEMILERSWACTGRPNAIDLSS